MTLLMSHMLLLMSPLHAIHAQRRTLSRAGADAHAHRRALSRAGAGT